MDLQKHGFWVGLGVILAVELIVLFLLVLPTDSDVDAEAALINRKSGNLQKAANKPFIPNNGDLSEMNQLRKEAAEELIRSMIYLYAIDSMTLERRWLGDDKTEITKLANLNAIYKTRQKSLTDLLKAAKDPKAKPLPKYIGLECKMVTDRQGTGEQFPLLFPAVKDDAGVPLFYRQWWVMEMVLDSMIAPAAADVWNGLGGKAEDRSPPWQLMELSFGPPVDVKDPNSYVHQYIPVLVRLRLKVIELSQFFKATLNSSFLIVPKSVDIYIDSEDPDEIPIHVEIGKQKPTPDQIAKMASKRRPRIMAEIGLLIADLDPAELIKVAKKFRKYLGDRTGVEAFIKTLKDDPDFIKPYEGFDKNAFLDRMTDELMAE